MCSFRGTDKIEKLVSRRGVIELTLYPRAFLRVLFHLPDGLTFPNFGCYIYISKFVRAPLFLSIPVTGMTGSSQIGFLFDMLAIELNALAQRCIRMMPEGNLHDVLFPYNPLKHLLFTNLFSQHFILKL